MHLYKKISLLYLIRYFVFSKNLHLKNSIVAGPFEPFIKKIKKIYHNVKNGTTWHFIYRHLIFRHLVYLLSIGWRVIYVLNVCVAMVGHVKFYAT
jgi:hypothetical protein